MKKIAIYLISKLISKDFILITLKSNEIKQRKAKFEIVATMDVKQVCKEIIKTL